MLLLVTLVTLFVYIIYKYVTPNYWKKRGISHIKPWPLLGNMGPYFFGRRPLGHNYQDLYNVYPDKRYVGIYNTTKPELLVRDPEIMKIILVKEFDSFPEHRAFLPRDIDPLWDNNLFAMRGGERWHNMRSTLSPTFTSSKLRNMFVLMKECAENFSAYYLNKGGLVSLEMKDALSRFSNDCIASTAFGVACDSFNEPNNEFYTSSMSMTKFDFFQSMKVFGYLIIPSIFKMFQVKIFRKETVEFFSRVIKETINVRQEKSVVRLDLIHLLMEARQSMDPKKSNFKLTDDDITSQALVFHFGGFDTTSTVLSHTANELAINPDIQAKLRDEVDETLAKCNGDITYDALNGMKYLDMVLSESLRKWPPFVVSDRVAKTPFTIEPELQGEQPLYLPAGMVYKFATYAMHRDPKYFPNPDKFDPERFSDENKHRIVPYTYLPFGAGPRNCIGARLALLQGKLLLFELISKFEIVPTEKTQIPLVISPKSFMPVAERGFWLGLKPRHED